eukprot:symbB.v1.2.011601.t1/scaffold776.1/size163632/4
MVKCSAALDPGQPWITRTHGTSFSAGTCGVLGGSQSRSSRDHGPNDAAFCNRAPPEVRGDDFHENAS